MIIGICIYIVLGIACAELARHGGARHRKDYIVSLLFMPVFLICAMPIIAICFIVGIITIGK